MQTPKARAGSLEVPQKTSPATPRTARKLKTTSSESDSASSHPLSRTPKDKSPKVIERRSPRSPVTEKKRPSRLSELESQIAQLQDDLKKAKDQLGSSESWKRHAQQEAEEAKKQVLTLTVQLEESQRQLVELSASEEARFQELRKISQERDRAWQSELEAVQKQHSVDPSALASATNEIQRLKVQLEMVGQSEAAKTEHAETAHTELQCLKLDLAETRSLVENLKVQLNNSHNSEAQAQEMVSDTLQKLETTKITMETLRSDGIKTMEAYSSLSSELEQSKARVKSLEELVSKLQADLFNESRKSCGDILMDGKHAEEIKENGDIVEADQHKVELNSLKLEVGELGSALEATEMRYQEELIRSTMQVCGAYEVMEQTKCLASLREAEMEAELNKTKAEIEELKANLMDRETELQGISEENVGLNMKIEKNQLNERQSELEMELKKSMTGIADLKASLMDKETELQSISEENEILKSEIKKREMERCKVNEEAVVEAEAARAAEQEALRKLGYMTEEADKSNLRTARLTEQFEAAQAANSEMEAELRRIKVQSDQWRKAAEAAAAVLSVGNNGKFMERSGSLDSTYHPSMGNISSPYSEDMDDDSPKKKNSNMLKKIGVLWKKGQK